MIFDFLVTLLAVIKLWAWRKQGGLSQMMFENGIVYFIFASCGNLVQAVLAALNLSGLLNVLFLPVAMCISVIGTLPNHETGPFELTEWLILASTRVFIRLLSHADPHNTYTSQTGDSNSVRASLAVDHYPASRLGPQSHLPPALNSNVFPVAPGFDQPYGLNTVKK